MSLPSTSGSTRSSKPPPTNSEVGEEEKASREARRSLAEFIRHGWHVLEPAKPLDWNWHIAAIADHVQAAFEDWIKRKDDPTYVQRIQNLLINIPPGTMKSRIVSVYAVAWMWLQCPSWRVHCLSTNPRVALRDSMYCRELIESPWYQRWFEPDWQLAPDQNAKSLFENTAGGFRAAMGWTAQIVGERSDAIIADDPNDPEEVESEVQREAVNDRWDATIGNRVNDLTYSVRIGIQQRVHENDWSGHILAKGGWELLCLPLEYEPERYEEGAADHLKRETSIGWQDPRTEKGEVLHPVRWPPHVIESEKKRLSFRVPGQLQQRPAAREGGMFKREFWRFWKPDGVAADAKVPRPAGCWTGPAVPLPAKMDVEIITGDLAFKKTKTSDRVAFFVIGTWKANRYILARRCARMTMTETETTFRELVALFPRAQKKLIEDKANGPAIIDRVTNEIPGVIAVNPQGGKESRASAMQPEVESGNWYLPEGAPWLDDFVTEFGVFPNGAHDDQVDACSQGAVYLAGNNEAERQRLMAGW